MFKKFFSSFGETFGHFMAAFVAVMIIPVSVAGYKWVNKCVNGNKNSKTSL